METHKNAPQTPRRDVRRGGTLCLLARRLRPLIAACKPGDLEQISSCGRCGLHRSHHPTRRVKRVMLFSLSGESENEITWLVALDPKVFNFKPAGSSKIGTECCAFTQFQLSWRDRQPSGGQLRRCSKFELVRCRWSCRRSSRPRGSYLT
jgi:hypothetical protein